MAGTAVTIRQQYVDGGQVDRMRLSINALVADVELLRARLHAVCGKLDADAGVTDTNYAAGTYSSTSSVSAASVLTGYTISTFDG